MKKFVIGDVHGGHKALVQVLQRANFNYGQDTLICLGDVADGWPEVKQCFDELLKIKNLIYILGNHDAWFLNYLVWGDKPSIWLNQGGKATLESYKRVVSKKHKELLNSALDYYIDDDNNLFIHAGYDWQLDINSSLQSREHRHMAGRHSNYNWDRHMWEMALMWEKHKTINYIKDYTKIFIGHTTTSRTDPELKPVKATNIWNLDQGAGYEGKLTLMNVDTEEYFQSDIVGTLYPNHKHR